MYGNCVGDGPFRPTSLIKNKNKKLNRQVTLIGQSQQSRARISDLRISIQNCVKIFPWQNFRSMFWRFILWRVSDEKLKYVSKCFLFLNPRL